MIAHLPKYGNQILVEPFKAPTELQRHFLTRLSASISAFIAPCFCPASMLCLVQEYISEMGIANEIQAFDAYFSGAGEISKSAAAVARLLA
jgi:hypothetical protein